LDNEDVKAHSQISLLARTFASPCLGHKPKARVAIELITSLNMGIIEWDTTLNNEFLFVKGLLIMKGPGLIEIMEHCNFWNKNFKETCNRKLVKKQWMNCSWFELTIRKFEKLGNYFTTKKKHPFAFD
jgi:hypothetical protein